MVVEKVQSKGRKILAQPKFFVKDDSIALNQTSRSSSDPPLSTLFSILIWKQEGRNIIKGNF